MTDRMALIIGFAINLTSLAIALFSLYHSRKTGRHVERHLKRNEAYSETILASIEIKPGEDR